MTPNKIIQCGQYLLAAALGIISFAVVLSNHGVSLDNNVTGGAVVNPV